MHHLCVQDLHPGGSINGYVPCKPVPAQVGVIVRIQPQEFLRAVYIRFGARHSNDKGDIMRSTELVGTIKVSKVEVGSAVEHPVYRNNEAGVSKWRGVRKIAPIVHCSVEEEPVNLTIDWTARVAVKVLFIWHHSASVVSKDVDKVLIWFVPIEVINIDLFWLYLYDMALSPML